MNDAIDIIKRVVVAILLITITNMLLDNSIPYSLFNVAFVSIFSLPGMLVLIFIIHFLNG